MQTIEERDQMELLESMSIHQMMKRYPLNGSQTPAHEKIVSMARQLGRGYVLYQLQQLNQKLMSKTYHTPIACGVRISLGMVVNQLPQFPALISNLFDLTGPLSEEELQRRSYELFQQYATQDVETTFEDYVKNSSTDGQLIKQYREMQASKRAEGYLSSDIPKPQLVVKK